MITIEVSSRVSAMKYKYVHAIKSIHEHNKSNSDTKSSNNGTDKKYNANGIINNHPSQLKIIIEIIHTSLKYFLVRSLSIKFVTSRRSGASSAYHNRLIVFYEMKLQSLLTVKRALYLVFISSYLLKYLYTCNLFSLFTSSRIYQYKILHLAQ